MTKKGQVLFTTAVFLITLVFATSGLLIYKSIESLSERLDKITNQQNLQEQQIKLNADLISDTQEKQEQSYDALQKQVTELQDLKGEHAK